MGEERHARGTTEIMIAFGEGMDGWVNGEAGVKKGHRMEDI